MICYLDNSATTRPTEAVADAMRQCMLEGFHNPSALYAPAVDSEKRLTACREAIARELHADPARVVFTSGGTEADNLAIFGSMSMQRGGRVLYTAGEHPAVAAPCESLKGTFDVQQIPYDAAGVVRLDALEELLTPDTRLICVMQVNNESGAVMPLCEIAQLRDRLCPQAMLHVDGVQGFMRLPVDMRALGIDSYALSGHKIHGPKGIGALVMGPRMRVAARMLGGGQEKALRSGTENTPGIAGFMEAAREMKAMPDRVFDVGIAEGHAVTFSGGMAKDGLMPFCNIYSAFAQRAYDNIIHDAALLNLPIVICLDRAGLVGEDGATHHGAFDIAALRTVPNLTLASPMDECELRRLMYTAQLPGKGTFVIRYPRGRGSRTDWQCPLEEIEVGRGRRLREGSDVAVLSYGPLGVDVEKVIDHLAETHPDLSVAHYDLRFCKPLDEALLQEVGERFKRIVTIEDGARAGGIGSAVLEWMSDNNKDVKVERIGLPDTFIEHGTVAQLKQIAGIDIESIKKSILL